MLKVMSLPLNENVQSLYRLLQAKGVRLLIVEEAGEQVLYVENPEHRFIVHEAYQHFRTDPATSHKINQYWQQVAPNYSSGYSIWPVLLASPVVSLLLLSLAIAGVWTGFGQFDSHRAFLFVDRYHFLVGGGTTNLDILWQLISEGNVWRLFAPAWLHWSLFHWLFNSLGLWILGRSLEKYLGSYPFLLLVLFSALVANISQFLVGGAGFGGFSGVVFALVGGQAMGLMLAPEKACWAHRGVVGISIIWMFAAMLGVTEFVGVYVANTAHFTGFICGVVWLVLLLSWQAKSARLRGAS